MATGGDAKAHLMRADHHVPAQQLAQELRALRAKGFVQRSCTVGGTKVTNFATGESMTVSW
jgi:hypothetical protein